MSDRRLLGRPRYVVRYWEDEERTGRVVRDETLAGAPPKLARTRFGDVLVYSRQADGNVHVISTAFVKDVVIEQGDRYGDWHKVGTWEGA